MNISAPGKTIVGYMLLAVAACSISACANFNKLEQDLDRMEDATHEFQLKVDAENIDVNAIVVVALHDPEGRAISGFTFGTRPTTFDMLLKSDPTWFFAYNDTNRDLRFQHGEPYGWAEPRPIDPKSDQDRLVRIVIRPDSTQHEAPPASLVNANMEDSLWRQIKVKIGNVTTLDDPAFSTEQAEKGLWQPFAFLEDGGTGIHFLEPYDPARTPVLFVHGINGTPRNFTALIENLDRSRYQAWVVSYPSGLALDTLGTGIGELMHLLHHKYQFPRLHLVAYSMGGLVSRRGINDCTEQNLCGFLASYITISTPWGGVASAKTGVDWAPAVVPVWHDLSPDSAFIDSLMQTPLPVPHHLLFSFKSSSIFGSESSDGIILLSSQLTQSAQDQASSIHGYDEGHVSILSSPLLLKKVYAIFDAASPQ
jgi:pimeloyl-ACP methyl ester carboxylesterase